MHPFTALLAAQHLDELRREADATRFRARVPGVASSAAPLGD